MVIKFLLFSRRDSIMRYLKYLLIINQGKITFKEGKEVDCNERKR